MKHNHILIVSVFSLILFSCNDQKNVHSDEHEAKTETNTDPVNPIKPTVEINLDSIVNLLQGKWKEQEYPYRLAEFRASTVKFIEEGVSEKAEFRKFSVSTACSYNVNNIKHAKNDDVFLVLEEMERCEIINVKDSLLSLSGFNVSSGQDYKIQYKKVK